MKTGGVELFQSTLPVRGATIVLAKDAYKVTISIHAPREGSDGVEEKYQQWLRISIHAPREGSDLRKRQN